MPNRIAARQEKDRVLAETRELVEKEGTVVAAAAKLKISPQLARYRYQQALRRGLSLTGDPEGASRKETKEINKNLSAGRLTLDYTGTKIETADQLVADCEIDTNQWYINKVKIKNWEVGGKFNAKGDQPDRLWKQPLRSITVELALKTDERRAFESIAEDMKANSPVVKKIKYAKGRGKKHRRALEICLMDPHFGMHCFPPASNQAWSMEDCEKIIMWAIDDLISQAVATGPVEKIIFPFGNDFLHHDSVHHTTTRGTPQPEGMAWHTIYEQGLRLAIAMVERMKQVAPVEVYQIPGNHDTGSSYTLGHALWCYYYNDQNVTVDASSEPYKFVKYGTNLIGFEHGHHVNALRLASLMANECSGEGPRKGWFDSTTYREWHLGDQHRKASSKPSTFEEQGVSVEYLPGLTPANEWHKQKAFNWQKRGAMAYVWDYNLGPRARLQSNLSSYTGRPTGMSRKEFDRLFDKVK